MASQAYADWLADGSPWEFARPIRALGDRLAAHGYTVYFQGNLAHLTKATPEDHCPFSATGWPGRSPYPYCMATDIMPPKPGQVSKLTGRPLPSLSRLASRLRQDRIDGRPSAAFVKYLNWEPGDGNCWHDSWQPDYARTVSGDRGHIHVSARTDAYLSAETDGYDLVARTEGTDVTLRGYDASHYDAASIAAAAGQGFAFSTHKIGGDARDAEFGDWWNLAKAYGPDRHLPGAYFILRPDLAGSAAAKADAFVDLLDTYGPGWRDRPFMLQIDCEKWAGAAASVPSLAYIHAHCDRLVARAPKLRPIVYGPKWVYGTALTGLRYPLWASAYVGGSGSWDFLYPGDGAAGWGAYGGRTPAVLQFSSSATIAGQTTCDADAFRGTLAQLSALVAPGWGLGTDMAATQDQIDAGRIALAQIFDEASKGSTATGRAFRVNLQALVKPLADSVIVAVGAADANDPGQMAAAFEAALGSKPAPDQAAALRAVLTPAQIAALIAALSPQAPPPATAGQGGSDHLPEHLSPAENELTNEDRLARSFARERQGRIGDDE